MKLYHKINSIYKRDEKGKFLLGEYSTPEIEFLKDAVWEWTEKVDGTNIVVSWDGSNIKYGGKTTDNQIPLPLLYRLQELFETIEQREKLSYSLLVGKDSPVYLYGEGYGNKIQKVGSRYLSDNVDFALFDIQIGDYWFERKDVNEVADELGLRFVPVVGHGTLAEAEEFVKKGFDSAWGDFPAEGLVLRPMVQLSDRMGDRIITKIKCRDYKKDYD